MRDKDRNLRSNCTTCDCPEYAFNEKSIKCDECGCSVARHRLVDDLMMGVPGAFGSAASTTKGARPIAKHTTRKTSTTKASQSAVASALQSAASAAASHISMMLLPSVGANGYARMPTLKEYLGITNIESLTLNVCQRLLYLWAPCIAALTIGSFIITSTNENSPAVSRLYMQSAGIFTTSTILAHVMFTNTTVHAKRVVAGALIAINSVMMVTYLLMWLRMVPRLPTLIADHDIEPVRYLAWLVAIPTLIHVVGDTTSAEDLEICSRISYFQLVWMFLSAFISPDAWPILNTAWILATFAIMRKLTTLFNTGIDHPKTAMMDRRSLVLAKAVFTIGAAVMSAVWFLKRGNVVTHAFAESFYSVSDTATVAGLTAVLAFSDVRELDVI